MEIDKLYYTEDRKVINEAAKQYLSDSIKSYKSMPFKQYKDLIISELNYMERSSLKSCRSYGLTISPGDVCFIDFRKAYLSESGFQHFGLVINVFYAKAFVIPMTSNETIFNQAYDEKENPNGLRHIMRLGKVEGLYKYSVLFLNDGKYINTARVIDIKGHIDTDSKLYKQAFERFVETLRIE